MKKLFLFLLLAHSAITIAQSSQPKIKTQITPKRIIVTSEKISANDFDTLIKKTLELYKDRHGTQLIVKAPGHKTFNHKNPEIPVQPIAFKILYSKDSLNKLKPEPVKFHPQPQRLPATKDSLPAHPIRLTAQ